MIEPLHDLLDTAAATAPEKVAVITDEGSLGYRELAGESRTGAGWLHALGVRRGDRVAVLLPNRAEVITLVVAASRLGAIFVVLNEALKPGQVEHILADSAPRVLLTTTGRALALHVPAATTVATLDDYRVAIHASEAFSRPFPGITIDPVCVIYTSGSTGGSKGVVCTHRQVRFAAGAIQARLGVVDTDVVGVFLPLSFDYGLYQVFLAFQAGATVALGSPADVGPALLRKVVTWHVTGLPIVPSMATILLRLAKRGDGRQLHGLRFITNTGERLAPGVVDELKAFAPACRVFVMYGLTECKRVSILDPDDFARKRNSVGTPLPDSECVIVDEAGRRLPPRQVGELIVRGPHVMSGYWNDPVLTATRFRPWGPSCERVLFTGDRCSMDEDGFLYFHGRHDDLYKQQGYRVSALEIEAAAREVPRVTGASLVPPDEHVGAMLFVTGDVDAADVIAGLRDRLEDSKMPEVVTVIEALPLTEHGKVDKSALRARRRTAAEVSRP